MSQVWASAGQRRLAADVARYLHARRPGAAKLTEIFGTDASATLMGLSRPLRIYPGGAGADLTDPNSDADDTVG